MNANLLFLIKEDLSVWKKSLDHFCQENALLKFRLSEIVDNNEDKYFLQMAEYFQNQLLLNDEKLKNLIRQVRQISLKTDSGIIDENTVKHYEKLFGEMSTFEKKYGHLSKEFNEKLLQNS